MSSDASRLRVNPQFIASKKKRKKVEIDDPAAAHLSLKNFLIKQRLMVERSALPEKRKEVTKIDYYLSYLRSLE